MIQLLQYFSKCQPKLKDDANDGDLEVITITITNSDNEFDGNVNGEMILTTSSEWDLWFWRLCNVWLAWTRGKWDPATSGAGEDSNDDDGDANDDNGYDYGEDDW